MSLVSTIDIAKIITIAEEAGAAIMKIYITDFTVENKSDASPLTEADKASNAVIIQGLQALYPEIPVISEETKLTDYSERENWAACWVVDPLDGTKEFIKKNGEFTVNIALVENGIPVLGVVSVPALNKTYYGIKGEGSFLKNENGQISPIQLRPLAEDGVLKIVGSRSHNSPEVDAYIEELKSSYPNVDFVAAGSSLKFCLVAEGKADIYPRLAPTMEWDTCAGQVVANEAGAVTVRYPELTPLNYNKENLLNPFFIVKNPLIA